LLEFGKALEVHCNNLLREAVEPATGPERFLTVGSASQDITTFQMMLSQIITLLKQRTTAAYLRKTRRDGDYLAVSLPEILTQFAAVRNKVAHQDLVERKVVIRWRDLLCGVGADGVIARLAGLRA
jgi:hypothetical protein